MADISLKFGTPKAVSFMEKGIDDPLYARFFGSAVISEYDTSRYPDDDAAIIAVKSGVMDMSDEIFADWPAGDVMDSNKEEVLASCFVERFEKLGIKASFEVLNFQLTEESQKLYDALGKKKIVLDFTSGQPKLSDLTPEEHGPVIEIHYSHSSHGMSMGSGTTNSDDIVWQEDGSVIIESRDHSNGNDTYTKYIAGSEAAEKLRKYVKDAHLAEMAQVGFIPSPFQMTDYSSSSSLRLTFDDGKDGTQVKVTRSLNTGSYWKLQSDAVSGMFDIVNECTSTGTCLEMKTTPYDIFSPAGTFTGFVGMGMMCGNAPAPADSKPIAPEPAKPAPGKWICGCGSENSDSAKFCPECGTPRPAEKPMPAGAWNCPSCGAENFGKFCAECGTPKPV